MRNINETKSEFIDRIIGIISLEKGLSQNTKIAYKKDISLIFDWLKKNNINFLNANEYNFREF